MDNLLPELFIQLLYISLISSAVVMALIQKIKSFSLVKKSWQLWLLNLLFSFLIGIPFGKVFYDLNIINSIWVAIFSFIGAPTIYELLKNQNLINYKPKSLTNINDSNTVTIPIDNEIKRK